MSSQGHIKPIVYGIFNVGVGCGIVFVNKAVLSVFNFKFVYCLTLIHTIVTMVGMWMFAAGGIFEIKRFTALQVCFWHVPLSLALTCMCMELLTARLIPCPAPSESRAGMTLQCRLVTKKY